MLTTKQKNGIIQKFRVHEKDTGSSDVQIAVMTEEIARLAAHLKKHPNDNHSRRGLLTMVANRKRLLNYLSRKNNGRYHALIKTLRLKQ